MFLDMLYIFAQELTVVIRLGQGKSVFLFSSLSKSPLMNAHQCILVFLFFDGSHTVLTSRPTMLLVSFIFLSW